MFFFKSGAYPRGRDGGPLRTIEPFTLYNYFYKELFKSTLPDSV